MIRRDVSLVAAYIDCKNCTNRTEGNRMIAICFVLVVCMCCWNIKVHGTRLWRQWNSSTGNGKSYESTRIYWRPTRQMFGQRLPVKLPIASAWLLSTVQLLVGFLFLRNSELDNQTWPMAETLVPLVAQYQHACLPIHPACTCTHLGTHAPAWCSFHHCFLLPFDSKNIDTTYRVTFGQSCGHSFIGQMVAVERQVYNTSFAGAYIVVPIKHTLLSGWSRWQTWRTIKATNKCSVRRALITAPPYSIHHQQAPIVLTFCLYSWHDALLHAPLGLFWTTICINIESNPFQT